MDAIMVFRPLAEVQLFPLLPGVAWPLLALQCSGAGMPRCSSNLALNMFMFVAIFTLSGILLYSFTTLLEKNSLLTSKLACGPARRAWYPLWPLVDVAPSQTRALRRMNQLAGSTLSLPVRILHVCIMSPLSLLLCRVVIPRSLSLIS
jgi:hypothetical protein